MRVSHADFKRELHVAEVDRLSQQKYPVVVFWSHDDNCWFAFHPDLPGAMAHGDTPAAALEAAGEARRNWIETALAHGWDVPEPSDKLVRSILF